MVNKTAMVVAGLLLFPAASAAVTPPRAVTDIILDSRYGALSALTR
jgi:hypothetical protein